MRTLAAQTQYGDWKGTAAADDYADGKVSFEQVFEATANVKKDNEILIGLELSADESSFLLCKYFHAKSREYEIGEL